MNAVRWMAAVALALGLLGATVPGQEKVVEGSEKERKQLEGQVADLNRQVVSCTTRGGWRKQCVCKSARWDSAECSTPRGSTPTATPTWPPA
jgi:hypothetical protein